MRPGPGSRVEGRGPSESLRDSLLATRYSFDGVERAAADEGAEETEDAALVLVEQPVAPADRVAECALSGRQVAWAISQNREAAIQSGEQGAGGL